MTDRIPDSNPDSRPREEDRGSIERIDVPREPDEADPALDDAGNGAVGGTDGVTKNQDATAQ